jgi:uncharacterized damage-inducible protein DinB
MAGWDEPDEHGRLVPPAAGPELDMLKAFLDFHRATLLWKVQGASDKDLRRSMVPSGTSLLGLVKHLADVEQSWFVERFAGKEPRFPLWREEDPAATWRIEPDETTQQIVDLYRAVCDDSRDAIEGASLDDVAAQARGGETLRWIILHMIEETARHNGHADILREMVDGQTGE